MIDIRQNDQDGQDGPPNASQLSQYLSYSSVHAASAASAASVASVASVESAALASSEQADQVTSTLGTSIATSIALSSPTGSDSSVVLSSAATAASVASQITSAPSTTAYSSVGTTFQTSSVTSSAADQTQTTDLLSSVTVAPTLISVRPSNLSPYSSDAAATSQSAAASDGSQTPYPDINGPQPNDRSHSPSAGIVAAAVVPTVLVLSAVAFLLLFIRRRRQKQGVVFKPMTEVKEKMFPKRSSSTGGSIMPMAGAAMMERSQADAAASNPTYYTGLDTESQHSAAQPASDEPPPPYRPRSLAPAAAMSDTASETSTIARPQASHIYEQNPVPMLHVSGSSSPERSPFEDPPAVAAAVDATRPSASRRTTDRLDRPEMSRNASARSITSTLYSSNASIMEAQPTRLSIGGLHVINPSGMERSPFADPDDSD